MSKDYYEILGVKRDADSDEVKKAFRRKAREYHPDQARGDKKEAEKKFKEISEAYEVLGDKQKRQQYDQFGASGQNFGGGQGPGGFDFSGGGFNFGGDAGGFGDIFETFFGGGGGRKTAKGGAMRGNDLEAQLGIKFEDSIFGTTAEFNLTRALKCSHCGGNGAEPGSKIETCKTCKGTGEVTTTRQTVFGAMRHTAVCGDCEGSGKTYEKKCSVCHGTGRERKAEKVKVKIPAGVNDGAVIKLAGQGEAGTHGGPSGDLFIHIRVEASREFERKGNDIYSTQKTSYIQATLGDEIPVKTVYGDVKLRIPAGTQSHQIFKLKNHGAPRLNTSEKGDHLVKILVEIPKKLSRKEKDLFEKLAQEAGIKIKKGGLFE
ncbi:MAG: molecular chaperone DnaJ [Candidatus Gracilibacteria bacterium]|jgi:molecular chaperone DnaJ|nr:molecular chaperone DnaJ [Candidatus Gracilibacteria bacterium]MDD5178957.1 molecular chaperone DnaJ [Candidatus Gracilibacteria bacterium]